MLGANLLVTHVSAVGALARSLAMNAKAGSKAELEALYGKYRDEEVKKLVMEYLGSQGKTTDIFGEPSTKRRRVMAVTSTSGG